MEEKYSTSSTFVFVKKPSAQEVEMIVSLISALTEALLPGVLWRNRMNSLVAAVVGLILAGKANMWEMGVKAPGQALEVNKGKRIYRLFNNLNINLDEVARALLRVLTVNVTDVIVAIDWTEFGSWKILKAAVVAQGRGIPVYWKAVKDGRRRMAEVELEFCDTLLQLVPSGKRLCIIGDRGFDSAEIVRFLKERAIKFALRFSHGVCIRLRDADFVHIEELPLKVGQLVDYGRVEYTKAFAVPARVVRTWMAGQDEEWNLVTNLGKNALAELIVKLYGRRFTIEELFRDLKGGAWGLAKTAVRTEAAMERLVLILAVAHIILVTIGRWAKKNGLERQFRSTEGLSLFRLGERVVRAAANGNLKLLPAIDFDPQFSELPITLDEIVQLPWNTKKRSVPEKQEIPTDRMRAYLLATKLTQPELAKVIGCQQSSVSNVSTGRMPMPPAWLPKLLEHANMTQEQFLSLPSPPVSPEQNPVFSANRLRAYLASQKLTQFALAQIVGSNQPKVCLVAAGSQPMPDNWLPDLLKHANMTEEEFLALPSLTTKQEPLILKPTQPQLPRDKRRKPDPPLVSTDDAILQRRRHALRVLWRKHKQKDLAAALGVGQPEVSRAVTGKRSCPDKWVLLLCDAYGLTEDEFLALGEAPMEKAA
jgi:plasmid maintenance system antidote protein VapI